jgi:hypothetical protein
VRELTKLDNALNGANSDLDLRALYKKHVPETLAGDPPRDDEDILSCSGSVLFVVSFLVKTEAKITAITGLNARQGTGDKNTYTLTSGNSSSALTSVLACQGNYIGLLSSAEVPGVRNAIGHTCLFASAGWMPRTWGFYQSNFAGSPSRGFPRFTLSPTVNRRSGLGGDRPSRNITGMNRGQFGTFFRGLTEGMPVFGQVVWGMWSLTVVSFDGVVLFPRASGGA